MPLPDPRQVIEPDSSGVSAKLFYIFGDTVKHRYNIIIDTTALYSSRNSSITRASSSGLW
jgi:hypothetical protein